MEHREERRKSMQQQHAQAIWNALKNKEEGFGKLNFVRLLLHSWFGSTYVSRDFQFEEGLYDNPSFNLDSETKFLVQFANNHKVYELQNFLQTTNFSASLLRKFHQSFDPSILTEGFFHFALKIEN